MTSVGGFQTYPGTAMRGEGLKGAQRQGYFSIPALTLSLSQVTPILSVSHIHLLHKTLLAENALKWKNSLKTTNQTESI